MSTCERTYPVQVSVPRIPRQTRNAFIEQISTVVRAALHQIERWRERDRQRRALARLDDRMLRDIGLTREQAEREIRKAPWQL